MTVNETDVLIIGTGVAGLSVAIKLSEKRPDLNITLVSKSVMSNTNTNWAQGGIASVWDFETDSFDLHISDTLDAGDGLCKTDVVEMVVREGYERVKEMIAWGVQFDKTKEGNYDLGREGGHSKHRILHHKDLTGAEIQRTLTAKVKQYSNIRILENYFAVNLITQHHLGHNVTRLTPNIACYGAYIMDKTNKDIETFLAKKTVMASGGAGQIYRNTTNPTVATGDGIAMVYRAKGHISNMEFVQFHPTALFNPTGEKPDFLISEAVRGFGGILRTSDGQTFMERYDKRLSLAPRDIVARAIDNEMKKRGDEYVYLDCTHLDKEAFYNHFPTIYNKCKSLGIDPMKDYIPVVPACHYMCGGISTDKEGRTSIKHLYAAGECSYTGLHGANRLASNSLLEGLVYGHRAACHILESIDKTKIQKGIPNWDALGTTEPNELVLMTQSLKELKDIMSYYVGIVRSDVRLKRATDRLYLLYRETEALYHSTLLSPQLSELRNLITIGYLVTKSASMRNESRGLHFTTDYPQKHTFLGDTLL